MYFFLIKEVTYIDEWNVLAISVRDTLRHVGI